MRNQHSEASKPIENRSPSGPEIDYSPRTYALRDQLVFGVKLFAITGIIVLLLWLFERISP